MFFKQDLTTIPLVPTTPAQISLNLPCRLWMVEKCPQSAIARRAEIQLLVVFCVLFRKTIIAHEGARLHLPLPLCLDSVLVLADLLPADRAPVGSISLRILNFQEFLCLVDMTVAAKKSRKVPLFCRTVPVPAQLLVTDCAECNLFLAKDITQV
jgi:hypothetical protein